MLFTIYYILYIILYILYFIYYVLYFIYYISYIIYILYIIYHILLYRASQEIAPKPAKQSKKRQLEQPEAEATTQGTAGQQSVQELPEPSAKRMRQCSPDEDAGVERVLCMCMSDAEWTSAKVGVHLLRGFDLKASKEVHVIVCRDSQYLFTGTMSFGQSIEIKTASALKNCSYVRLDESLWSKRVKSKKSVHAWKISAIHRIKEPVAFRLGAPKFRSRPWWNSKEDLVRAINQPKPKQCLASTAAWFVGLMKLEDFELLRSRVRALDGACLRFGTTCSGIDVCSNMLRKTVAFFCESFDVACLYIHPSVFMYIYINVFRYIYNLHIYIYSYLHLTSGFVHISIFVN